MYVMKPCASGKYIAKYTVYCIKIWCALIKASLSLIQCATMILLHSTSWRVSSILPPLGRNFSNIFSRLPATEEELYAPCNKPVTFISEYADRGAEGFKLVSKHFPNLWGFLWHLKGNGLTPKIMALSKRRYSPRECTDKPVMMSQIDTKEDILLDSKCWKQ